MPATIRVLMPNKTAITMDMDEYLKGVLPREMGPGSPLEALKAQAVAARCYAARAKRHLHEGADICTTTHCQVWSPTHYDDTDRAVEETRGVVATYDNKIIRAYYFGHCDGHTRNSEDVWVQALPYCRSVPCVKPYPEFYGHGVGMCQRGAMAMAERGTTYEEILKHYYTGISLVATLAPPPPIAWTMTVERRPGARTIAGNFPRAGIQLTITDLTGNVYSTVSGSKTEHGTGGFEVAVEADGMYALKFLDETFEVEVRGDFVFATFEETVGVTARLVTGWMTMPEAEKWLEHFERYKTYKGMFEIEGKS